MTFIQDTEKTKIITPVAITVSPDKKYFAVSEQAEDDISNINFHAMISGAPLVSPQPAVPQV